MLVKSEKNFPVTPAAKIALGKDLFALVDPDRLDYLTQFNWFTKKSFYRTYAVRTARVNGKKVFVRMHRVIACTPKDEVCHHTNHDTLDNRKANLQNMSKFEHAKMHSYR